MNPDSLSSRGARAAATPLRIDHGAFAEAIEAAYDVRVPREPGQDTYASMEAAARGEIDAAVLLGGNLFGSNPDQIGRAHV